MKRDDIEIGETYLFIGSDSPKRKHLAGQPFTVVSKDQVYRKVSYRHKKRSMKVTRFFNDDGVGARPEELEPLSQHEWSICPTCKHVEKVADLSYTDGKTTVTCNECGEIYLPAVASAGNPF